MTEPASRTRPRWPWWAWQLVYALCVLGLFLLPAHRYGWMRELDPGFDGALPPDGSGNRWVAIAVLVAGAAAAQLIGALLARRPQWRWLALGLGTAAVVVALWRFGLP